MKAGFSSQSNRRGRRRARFPPPRSRALSPPHQTERREGDAEQRQRWRLRHRGAGRLRKL